MVYWLVERHNGDHYPLTWPVEHFGAAMQMKGHLAPSQIEEFCRDMVGRTMNLIFADAPNVDPDAESADIRG